MKTAGKIIEKALSFVGTREEPSGSNNIIFNTDYYGRKVNGSTYAWCATFVWDVFRLCEMSELYFDGNKTAYCPTVYNWGKSSGLTVERNKGKRGDVVLFDWNANSSPDHIGFIVAVNDDGTYATVEGNVGDAVKECRRSLSDICMIIRPKYEEEQEPKRYNRVSELPTSLQKETTELIDSGCLCGVNSAGDLDVTIDMLRAMIVAKRYAEKLNGGE